MLEDSPNSPASPASASPAVIPIRPTLVLECAPVGKYARVIHDFAVKRNLPGIVSIWGVISIPLGIALVWVLTQSIGAANSLIGFGGLEFLAFVPLLYVLLKVLSKPTHVCIKSSGVFYQWRRSFHFSGKPIVWDEILKISVVQPGNTSRVQSRVIRFESQDRLVELKVDEVTDLDLLPFLYEEILAYAPNVPRDPELQAILGHDKAGASYTELWLKALTAPPERSRLIPLESGTRLQDGKYSVLEKIGSGGQGVAYTATTDGGSDELVVLKEYILPVGVNHGSKVESLEKFQGEAQILSQIDHPQIVKMLDFFFEDHRAYMVLELVEGQQLHSIIKKNGVPPEAEIIGLAKQMLEILEYLHTRNPAIIHRDFSPDNLILGSNGFLKLIDFNVAKQQKVSATATVVGKHAYIAPDQFRGDFSPQSDLYSMGATLFFVATGTEPKPISVSHPREKNPQLSQHLDDFVARCTATELSLRFKSAEEAKLKLMELSEKG